MSFKKIASSQYDLARNAALHNRQLKTFAAKLSKGINDLLNSDYPVEQWGTSCALSDDGITLRISSPFGEARAAAIIQLNDGYIGARYVFEKLVSSSSGSPVFRPVWAVRINNDGMIKSEDGELIYRSQTFSGTERENGVATIALSAIYAVAAHDGYYIADSDVN